MLDEDHYDLDKVKDRIVEYLAVQKLRQNRSAAPGAPPAVGSDAPAAAPTVTVATMKGPILCFVGPPGVGKTSLGQSIARAMNRKFVRISLGGVRDEAEIRGHRRTYIGSMPGRLAQALKTAGVMNPVLMLDEIDKISVGVQGDPAAALLEVLDPAQNHAFRDHYLEITDRPVAGAVHRDGQPARNDPPGAARSHGDHLAERLHRGRKGPHRADVPVPRQLEEHGLTPEQLDITDAALRRIIAEYTREAGVRALERQIGTIARKVAARVATDPRRRAPRIDARASVPDYLGPPRFRAGERRSGRRVPASPPAWRGPRPAATCSTSKRRCCPGGIGQH